jgi:nicotinamide mononucleotide transporter
VNDCLNTTIDLVGASLSIISGFFYIKEKSIAWLISLLAIPFDIFMDISLGIYGDLLLQCFYFILLIYGWYAWRSGEKREDSLPMSKMTLRQLYLISLFMLLPTSLVWLSLDRYTDSNVAVLDSMVTVLSLLAQWLLCRKIIESWLLWIFVDSLYVALFVFKGMPFHASMAVFDTVVCIIGYLCWVKEFKQSSILPEVLALESEPELQFNRVD